MREVNESVLSVRCSIQSRVVDRVICLAHDSCLRMFASK